jgi:hypothetical protein
MLRTLSAALLAACMIVTPALAADSGKSPVADAGNKPASAKVDTAHAKHHRHHRHHAHHVRHGHRDRHGAAHHVRHAAAKGEAAKPAPSVKSAAPAGPPAASRTN